MLEVGIFIPEGDAVERLRPGEVGYIIANIKNTADVKIGDTITLHKNPAPEPLPGFRVISPVFLPGSIPSTLPILKRCAMLLANCSSTIQLCMLNKKAAWRLDLDSAAAF